MRPPIHIMRLLHLLVAGSCALATVVRAQEPQPSDPPRPLGTRNPGLAPPGWYSGDTHEHVQHCDDTLHGTDEVLSRMAAEHLDVASILIWERPLLPFTESVCRVIGQPDDLSSASRVLQYGVETSGLTCARWGHLIGLGIGAEQARIAFGSTLEGDCDEMPGLGLGGDGSGRLSAPIARHFYTSPGAVCGYAHAVWTDGIYNPSGFDWLGELLAPGYTTDVTYLSPARKLAFPNLERLLAENFNTIRPFFPLLGAIDVALGNVQFVESIYSGTSFPLPVQPTAAWDALYEKLMSAGLRVGFAGGSDRACFPPQPDTTPMRTYARVDGPLTYGAWTAALAAGRTTIAYGNDVFLRMSLDGVEPGGDLTLHGPLARADAVLELTSRGPLQETLELLVQGEVVASHPVTLEEPGRVSVTFADVALPQSSWVAARLGSQRAQTAAVHAIVDARPIVDPLAAEYWMVWCDLLVKQTLEHPEEAYFGEQEEEALDSITRARRVFKTLRDVAGFDPTWGVRREGQSTAACRGPITIGVTGPARTGSEILFTCVNAPPLAEGMLYLSRAAEPAGDCLEGAALYVSQAPGDLVAVLPASTTRSGYAEVAFKPGLGLGVELHAQFVWLNPPDCAAMGCAGVSGARSASDALRLSLSKSELGR